MDLSLFRRQGGVASVAALMARGTTEKQIRWALQRGSLARIRHGWLRTVDADPAIVAAVAAGGRLSCVSALQHLGLWVPAHTGLHVSLPRHAGRHNSAEVTAHWQGGPWRSRRSPIEAIDEAVRQLVLCCDTETAVSVIDSALHRRKLTMHGLRKIVATLPKQYASLPYRVNALSESGYESLCRVRLSALGLTLRVQPVLERIGRVDLLVGDRLIIEADGREWHEGSEAFLVDRSRDLEALRRRYLPLRLAPHHVLYEWQWVQTVVLSLVASGEHRWTAAQRRHRSNDGFGG